MYDNGLNQPNQTAKVQNIEGATKIDGTNITGTNITGTNITGTNIAGTNRNLTGSINVPGPTHEKAWGTSFNYHENGRNYIRGITHLDGDVVINGTLRLNGWKIKTDAWKGVILGEHATIV